jgi:hypothetical protein
MDSDTEAQLAILRTLAERLATARLRFWLRGGWAVDFLLGEVTRRHGDIDLVTWLRHRRRIRLLLTNIDFEPIQEWEAQTDFRVKGQVVSSIYLTRQPDGCIITHGIPVWTWPDGSLSSRKAHLRSISARVMSPRQMLWEKEGYEIGTGRPPRPKDLESMTVLRGMIGGC